MELLKKTAALFLALGMTAGFAACGGDKGGDTSSSVDTGAAQGEQVTLAEWTVAVTNSFAANNVTMNTFEDMHLEEVWDDGEHVIYEGTTNGVIKLAGNVLYEKSSGTGTVNGVLVTELEEEYSCVNDGMYYKWSRESADGEWEYHESPYYAGMFDGTAGEIAFGNRYDMDWYIALYDQLEYDESTGEYSVYVEDEYDPFTMKCKIANDKIYTLTIRFEDTAETSPSEFGYIEYKYVFVDYGTTSVRLPNEEEEESGNGESSEEGKTSSSVSVWQPAAMTEEEWSAAFEATLAQTNFVINGNITMEAMGRRETGTETLVFEEEKMYHEEDTVTGVYRTYWGSVFNESYGYEVPYEWNWDNDTSSWDCGYADIGLVDAKNAFGVLTCDTYIDDLPYAYDNAVYNSEKGCYVIDLASLISSSSAITGTLEITFANGLIAKIKGASEDELFEGATMIEEYEYVITYGNATVGNLPAVTIL